MTGWEKLAEPARRPRVVEAAIVALLLSCATTAPTPPEDRVTTLVHDWFSLLERPDVEAADFERFLATPEIGLESREGGSIDVAALSERHRDLHSTFDQIAYQIEEIRVQPSGDDVYRARFDVERSAVDAEGTPHLARKRATWLVRADRSGDPAILGIEEQPLLPHPGSGSKIVCY